MVWHLMRLAAIGRHRALWWACGSDPKTWEMHMGVIRAFYGY